jgi:hypothetical protein
MELADKIILKLAICQVGGQYYYCFMEPEVLNLFWL